MIVVTTFFVFVLVWWVVIFIVLPFGNKALEKPEIGHAASAPANPRMKQKLIWTTGIAVVITAVIMFGLHYSGYSVHNMVKSWAMEQQN